MTSARKTSALNKISPAASDSLEAIMEEYTSRLEQRLMAQTKQLQTITDNAASCLFMIDAQGRVTFMNPAAQHVTGYKFEELQAQPLSQLLHRPHVVDESASSEVCQTIRPLEQLQHVRDQEDLFVRKDGHFFPVSYSVAPLEHDGVRSGAVLEFQDISKRKELERQKDEFIGVASHELKTPVTSMKTYAQVLRRQFGQRGDVATVASLDKIDVQINKLNTLIADLLDVTRAQTGNLSLHFESFDVDDLVVEIVENMQLTTQQHQLVIQGKAQSQLYADRDRVGQVLINFLSNAIKYSPESDQIVIHVEHVEDDIKIGVEDFGIGIPQDKVDQVFERFVRVSGPMMDTFPGLGLGLYISAQIIRRQGGQIWTESQEGQGSTFYFCLPRQAKVIS